MISYIVPPNWGHPVGHAEEVTSRVANQFSDGLTAAARNIEVVEHGLGPGLLSRRWRCKPETSPIPAADSVADGTTARCCPDERTAAVHREAALRVRAVGPVKLWRTFPSRPCIRVAGGVSLKTTPQPTRFENQSCRSVSTFIRCPVECTGCVEEQLVSGILPSAPTLKMWRVVFVHVVLRPWGSQSEIVPQPTTPTTGRCTGRCPRRASSRRDPAPSIVTANIGLSPSARLVKRSSTVSAQVVSPHRPA